MYCQTTILIFSLTVLVQLISNAKVVKPKENLLKKEYEYLKNRPLSTDLKKFISEIRKKRRNHLFKRNFNETTTTTISETVTINQDIEETTANMELLHKIHDDVEKLLTRNEESPREGFLCSLNGSWVSEAGGCRLDINYQTNTRRKFLINLGEKIPPSSDGFLNTDGWIVFGEMPFEHSGLVIALAIHPSDKHLATFIGECRTCEGYESVTGTWLIGRSSRDCKDQKVAHQMLSDVWRREMVHTLREKHLEEIGYTTPVN